MNIPCKLCEKRRARRNCPGIEAEICPQCCGTERENSIACPASCAFLREARFHEQPPAVPDSDMPNQDVRLSESFLRDNETVVLTLAIALTQAMQTSDAADFDAREGLDALIRTYRTRSSGLIYESIPTNPLAAGVHESLLNAIEQFRQALADEQGMHTLRDSSVLGALVFLQRLEMQYNNGRRRGKAFRDFLAAYLPERAAPSAAPSLVVAP